MTPPCERFDKEFLADLVRDVPLDSAHLASCAHCRELHAKYVRLIQMIPDALPQASLSANWQEVVLRRAAERTENGKRAVPTTLARRLYPKVAGALALAAAVVGALWIDGGRSIRQASVPTEAARRETAIAPQAPANLPVVHEPELSPTGASKQQAAPPTAAAVPPQAAFAAAPVAKSEGHLRAAQPSPFGASGGGAAPKPAARALPAAASDVFAEGYASGAPAIGALASSARSPTDAGAGPDGAVVPPRQGRAGPH